MRTVAMMVAAAVVSGDRLRGCLEPSGPDLLEVSWTLPASGPAGNEDHGVDLVGCADWDVQAGSLGMSAAPGWTGCAVVGWVRDGRLTVWSDPVPVDAERPHQELVFDLPGGPIHGIGVQIAQAHGTIIVQDVVPGSPAASADLAPGTLILEVDGVSTRGMSSREFV